MKNYLERFRSSSVYETSLSEFHELTLTVLRVFHVTDTPKIIQYRDFSHFYNVSFRAGLLQEFLLENVQPGEFEKIKYISLKLFNIHAPVKEKHVRCNQYPFMNKELRKASMTRTRLLNNYKKDYSVGNLFTCEKQRNLCVKLRRKCEKDFYNNLNVKRITNNRKFWHTIKPNFN